MNPVVVAVLATVAIFLFALSLSVAVFIAYRIFKANKELGKSLLEATEQMASASAEMTGMYGCMRDSVELLADSVNLLAKAPEDLKEAREAILCMPEFAKGIEAVTKDQVAALIGMTGAIETFRKQMFSNTSGGLQEYDDGKAAIDDEAFNEQERVGCDMDEARERVKNRNLYKNMRMVT